MTLYTPHPLFLSVSLGSRAQRQAHNKLRESEAAAVAVDDANSGKNGKVISDKDKAKVGGKKKNLLDKQGINTKHTRRREVVSC